MALPEIKIVDESASSQGEPLVEDYQSRRGQSQDARPLGSDHMADLVSSTDHAPLMTSSYLDDSEHDEALPPPDFSGRMHKSSMSEYVLIRYLEVADPPAVPV